MSPAKGQTSPRCKRGHLKSEVGTRGNGWCNACAEASEARRNTKKGRAPDPANVNFRNPYCPNGHEKRIVGVGKRYECLECRRIRVANTDWSLYRRQLHSRRAGLPEGSALGRWTPLPKLKELRLRSGRTQGEMAALLGVSRRHYGMLEAGKKRALRSTVAKVMEGVARTDAPTGKYRKLLDALKEAERRGEPTAAMAAHILGVNGQKVGPSLRWLAKEGLVERFETDGVYWLVSEQLR